MAKGLSLRSLASTLGVSASLLSQVETGKTQPSVSTLYALVNQLGISLDDLVLGEGAAGAPQQAAATATASTSPLLSTSARRDPIQRGTDNPVIEMENGVRWERLAVGAGHDIDPLLVTYAPSGASSVADRLMRHSGWEYAYLFSGELTVHLDFDTYVMRPGDSLSFDSTRPHMYVNHGAVPAKGLWFVVGRLASDPHHADTEAASPSPPDSAVDVLHALDRLP